MAKLTEKQQKKHDLIKKWVGLEKAIKEWKMHIEMTKIELEKLMIEGEEYQYSPEVLVQRFKERKNEIDNEGVMDTIGLHPKYRNLLASNAFKIGELKKLEEMEEYYEIIYTDKIKIKKAKLTTQQLCIKLFEAIELYPQFLDVNEILLELQPTINPRMKMMSNILYAYFIRNVIMNKDSSI